MLDVPDLWVVTGRAPGVLAELPSPDAIFIGGGLTAEGLFATVARLHSGDLSIFSAVAEQLRRLNAAGVDYELVPGVPAFAAAAAALKRELSVPTVGQTVILTRIVQRATPMPSGADLEPLDRSGALMVLHLATQAVDLVVEQRTPLYGADCPAVVVAMASQPDEVILRGTVADIAEQVREAGLRRTAICTQPAATGA